MAHAPGLSSLYACSRLSAGTIPDSLVEVRVLRTLKLADNHLVGNIPLQIGKLRALEVLDVHNNSMSGCTNLC